MLISRPLLEQARAHWFLLLLPALFLLEFGFARTTDWSRPGLAEGAILFDLCLFLPLLYLICHRGKVTRRALALRTGGLFLLGLYVASLLVPPEAQRLLSDLEWLRPLGLLALALVELKLMLELARLVFSGRSDAGDIAARSGTPLWVVRLMLIEARFWKAVWRLLRGR